MMTTPELTGEAAAAVRHRGSHLQIIAAAGSGKTEVVSQRVADLIADGVSPRSIVAFTFTERAASELKDRIVRRVEGRLGGGAADALTGLFVGTIHAFCFQLLQRYVPRYESFDVLNENQLTAFLSREARRLGMKDLDDRGRRFESIAAFAKNVDVVENELLDPAMVPGRFGEIFREYLATLERYRLLTFGQQIVRAVEALENPDVAAAVHGDIRHLIVDEYQDVNPAQERLIELLVRGGAELCVVGDDDQAVYQWRGSDVGNIVGFTDRYPGTATFSITTNRRSRPEIISAANAFVASIPNRLDKQMQAFRPSSPAGTSVLTFAEETAASEADRIAVMIRELHDVEGVAFSDIAVLVRGRASYPALLEAFDAHQVPVQPGGRTGLFDAPEAELFGQAVCWLVDLQWGRTYDERVVIDENTLVTEFDAVFGLSRQQRSALRATLRTWKGDVAQTRKAADLISEFYGLCEVLGVHEWNIDDDVNLASLGNLARFSELLADYESVRRRARLDASVDGEQVGGEDRGHWYYWNLAVHILNYAQGAYEGFDGEAGLAIDAVDLTTVHRSKGLEWPVVFVPAMTARRFPSDRAGRAQRWHVPGSLFNAARYEGSDADERRLFYVAMTRARDLLCISRHERVNVQRTAASPYFDEVRSRLDQVDGTPGYPVIEPRRATADEIPVVSFSEMAQFLGCAMEYRLRALLGFQPRLAVELGYGKAVHHVLRAVADHTQRHGRTPSDSEIDRLLDAQFFLPTANKVAHRQMKNSARRLVGEYVSKFADDLERVWESERPFELRLDDVVITGRADVILDHEGGERGALAIVDYKTSTTGDDAHALQLQVYADAGGREGLNVRAAYVHDLKQVRRTGVDVGQDALDTAERTITVAAKRLRAGDFAASPGAACKTCEVRSVCSGRAREKFRRRR